MTIRKKQASSREKDKLCGVKTQDPKLDFAGMDHVNPEEASQAKRQQNRSMKGWKMGTLDI
jgi:hypothetical protein